MARAVATRRAIALVVDDLNLSFTSVHSVREALGKFVDEQMQPGDLVAIVRTGGGIGSLEQFSIDSLTPCGHRPRALERGRPRWK